MPSSVVKFFKYNEQTKTLRVVYTSGIVYDYLKVPASVYEEMRNAFSKGVFLNTRIKGFYKFEKVKDD